MTETSPFSSTFIDLKTLDSISRKYLDFDPVDFISKDYRFATWNAVCVLSLSDNLADDELVPRAKLLLGLVDDGIRRTYFKEKDARAASEVPRE